MNNDLRKDAKGKALGAINRRLTQMDTERNPFKNITAGAPFDGLRVVSQVEPQRA